MQLPDLTLVRQLVSIDSRMDATLDSGVKMDSYFHTATASQWLRKDFIDTVRQYRSKEKYTSGYEYFCGNGLLGFEMLGFNFVEHMTFTDYYDVALQECMDTAFFNGLTSRIRTQCVTSVSELPSTTQFDFVVSVPPHIKGTLHDVRERLLTTPSVWAPGYPKAADAENILRMVDEDWAQHSDFFTHLGAHTTEDVDVFIYEPLLYPELITSIQEGGFYIYEGYDIPHLFEQMPAKAQPEIHQYGKIYHLKK